MNAGKNPRDILRRPIVSEKSYSLMDEGKYTFEVDPDSNKTEIKIAIEQIFNVKVTSVNTLNRQGKRKDIKRAIVTLAAGQSIDVFSGRVG